MQQAIHLRKAYDNEIMNPQIKERPEAIVTVKARLEKGIDLDHTDNFLNRELFKANVEVATKPILESGEHDTLSRDNMAEIASRGEVTKQIPKYITRWSADYTYTAPTIDNSYDIARHRLRCVPPTPHGGGTWLSCPHLKQHSRLGSEPRSM
ncbi:hypothetical protein M426DRAFT_15916 [Hypoxylon sp. CI-4A]|nr:hypothetical protein M426DRAFT_15916 [Hypoxylon sp. CI-4A]